MKIKVQFTLDVNEKNVMDYLICAGFDDETVREYVQSWFESLAGEFDNHINMEVGGDGLNKLN